MSVRRLRASLDRSFSTAARLTGRQRDQRNRIPVEKSIREFAEMAVGPVYNKQVAEWIIDRNAYVKAHKNSVQVAVGAIARKLSMQEASVRRMKVKKSGIKYEPVKPTHPAAVLLREVNPHHTEFDIWYLTEAWKMLTGDAYWWVARNGFSTPKEVWPCPSQWVRVIPSKTEYIEAFEVRNLFYTEKPTIIPANDMVQFTEPNVDWSVNGRFYGASKLQSCSAAVDLEQTMFDRLHFSFSNFAAPGQIFSTDKNLTEPQIRQIYNQIIAQHSLSEHTGRPMITHSGLKPMIQTSSVKEMDYTKSLDVTMTLILATFGTPRAVVGLISDVNRANMEGAMLAWCENTINPRLKSNGQRLTYDIAREFEPDGSLVVQYEPCTVDDAEAVRKAVETCKGAGALDPNEIREILLKKGPFKRGGNRPLVPTSSTIAGWGNDAGTVPEPGVVQPTPKPAGQMFGQGGGPPSNGAPGPPNQNQNGQSNGQNGKPSPKPSPNGSPAVPVAPQKASGGLFNPEPERVKFGGVDYTDILKPRRLFAKGDAESVMELVGQWEKAHTRHLKPFSRVMLDALQQIKREAVSRYKKFSGITKSLVPVSGFLGTSVQLRKSISPDSVTTLIPPGKTERLLMEAATEQIFVAAMYGAKLELRNVSRFGKASSVRSVPSSARSLQGFMDIPPEIMARIQQTLAESFGMDYWQSTVGDTTREMVRAVLEEAIREGWTGPETAAYIESDPMHIFDKIRAMRIVRTETTGAINGGQWSAQQDLVDRDIIDGIEWLSILDRDTRNTHRLANTQRIIQRGSGWVVEQHGEIIGEGRLFVVGEERARFPGDPNLSAKERVHCRCLVNSVINED